LIFLNDRLSLSLVSPIFHHTLIPFLLFYICRAEFDRLNIVQWYVATNSDCLDLPCGNAARATPLHYAARAGRHNSIEYLLQNEIKLAQKHPLDSNGLEPIDWCIERRRDHVEYLFRDLASAPRNVTIQQGKEGRHRHMKINQFEILDPETEKEFQNEWYKRCQGVMVSSSFNELFPQWQVPRQLGGLPLLGYNIYCRRLRTYIPPLDQTIEGRQIERRRMMKVRAKDDSVLPNGRLGQGYTGNSEQTKVTVGPTILTTRLCDLWPACIYLVTIVPFSMLGEGKMSMWQEMQTAPW